MIPILTLAEIKEVERKAMSESGLNEFDMITSAGEAVFESMKAMLEEEYGERADDGSDRDMDDDEDDDIGGPPSPPPPPRRNRSETHVAFVCGSGHNGADGLSAALQASQAGYSVVVYQMQAEGRGYSRETERLQSQLADADIS